ncbi:MAG: class I SAM-dependent methyltransferase [Cyclobacteriaceae bacterium]
MSNTSHTKPVSAVAKSSLSSGKFSAFMHLLVNELRVKTVLETGTSLGINTLYLSRTSADKIVTMEASPIISELAKKEFGRQKVSNVVLEFGDIAKTFEPAIIRHEPDMVFLDADHRGSTIKRQVDQIMKQAQHVKCIVIHDIYWSKDMRDVWKELVTDNRFELSIDIFQAGLLFPHKDIEKQHFTLRF